MHRSKPAQEDRGARPVPLLAPFLALLLTPVSIPAATPPALHAAPPGESMGSDGAMDGPHRDFLSGVAAYDQGEYARAVRLWEEPARAGHAGAQFNLGMLYSRGEGVVAPGRNPAAMPPRSFISVLWQPPGKASRRIMQRLRSGGAAPRPRAIGTP